MKKLKKTMVAMSAAIVLGAFGAVATVAPASAAAGCNNWKATQNFRTTSQGQQVQLTRSCWDTHDRAWTEYKWVGV